MIEVVNLEKSFDDKKVLDGINLTVNEGERVVIIGTSGSGKSTLLMGVIHWWVFALFCFSAASGAFMPPFMVPLNLVSVDSELSSKTASWHNATIRFVEKK